MPEPIPTAEEFIRSLHMPYGAIGDRFSGRAVSQVQALIDAVRRKALEDAAAALCLYCESECDIEEVVTGCWYHQIDEDHEECCHAGPIRQLLAKLEPEKRDAD